MPNKHHPDKVQTGFWTEKSLKDEVQRILASKGTTLTDEIVKMMNKIVEDEIKARTLTKQQNEKAHKKHE